MQPGYPVGPKPLMQMGIKTLTMEIITVTIKKQKEETIVTAEYLGNIDEEIYADDILRSLKDVIVSTIKENKI